MINLFFLLISFLICPATVLAVDISTSATNSSEVQTIREVVQQKVKEKLNIITTPESKPKSLFGTIQKITDNQIEISFNNVSKIIINNEDTVLIGLKRNKIKQKDLKSGQEILALGYLNSKNQLEAKRIIIFELKKIENKTQVINGQIVDISKESLIFVVVPPKNKNSQYQVKTDTANLKKLSSGQKIIAVIKPDPKLANTFNLIKTISTESSASATPTPKP